MKNAGMKQQTTILLTLCLFLFLGNVKAQNEYMYIMKNGAVIKKQSIKPVDLDSVVYTEPAHVITSTSVSSIGLTTATTDCSIADYVGAIVSARGVCWSTSTLPTIALSTKTTDGTGTGVFSSTLTGLEGNTKYYVRAYATNGIGITAYGAEVSFMTSIADIDGNLYTSVTIGTQTWMVENLRTTHYRDGSSIPNVTDNSWNGTYQGAWCDYNNSTDNGITYGHLYNWFAVSDSRNIAPLGWHVPSDAEWTTLTTYLGGESVAGSKLKEAGTIHWLSPNTATNEKGFFALPGGLRLIYNMTNSQALGQLGFWWSATEYDSNYAWYRSMDGGYWVQRNKNQEKTYGFSVRCVKD